MVHPGGGVGGGIYGGSEIGKWGLAPLVTRRREVETLEAHIPNKRQILEYQKLLRIRNEESDSRKIVVRQDQSHPYS